MSQRIIKSALLVTSSILAINSFAQQTSNSNNEVTATAVVSNGSFSTRLAQQKLSQLAVEGAFNQILGLSSDYSFVKVKERMDVRGASHASYQQFYKGIKVDGGLVLMHLKNGFVTSINGTISSASNIATHVKVDAAKAKAIAIADLKVVKEINQYPAELVLAPVYKQGARTYQLTYKARVDGRTTEKKIAMYNVYIDANTGAVIKKASLIAHDDVTGIGQTFYSGEQTIVSDSFEGGFRLRDNGRKIETYDVANQEPDMWGEGPLSPFPEANDVVNDAADWGEIESLMSITLSEANDAFMENLGLPPAGTNLLAALVAKSGAISLDELELVSGVDVKYDVTGSDDLPVTSGSLYIPLTEPSYRGIFAKLNLMGEGELADTAYFDIADLTLGTHAWADTKGNSGNYVISSDKNPALDAHWGMGETHDYYMEIFDRNSYDGDGSVVKNFINGTYAMVGTQSNAAALPSPYNSMVYGLGDGVNNGPFVTLDVMGHEFTHMVTEHNGNDGLNYSGESGALNESFSDIFGTCIEFHTRGEEGGNYIIGEGVTLVAPFMMRSMSDPKSLEYPDTYLGDYWTNTSSAEDNGGVHQNSSVPNKWFYLLCEGGTGTNDNSYSYAVSPIGMTKAEQIAYLTLTEYVTPESQFEDAYNGSLNAAAELYGEGSAEQNAVELAWRAVGVPNNDETSIDNTSVAAKSVSVYPNPSTGIITIESKLNISANAGVYSIVGNKVMSLDVKPGINSFDLSTLTKGIYMIKYAAGNNQFVQKVVLK